MATQVGARDMGRLSDVFLEEISRMPGGDKIMACQQCGTCSGSCPTAYAMDYTPRQIIGWLRAGELEKVLNSNTMWMCASCYSCTVRCPAGIKVTDAMYELKRLAIKYGFTPRGVTGNTLATVFQKNVDKYGRSPEMELLARYYLSTNPFGMLKMAGLGLKLFRNKRISLAPEKIRGRDEIQKMLQYVREKGEW
ncbi:MAG: 4Fe-4S dicluster domain-containing protein [Chloroflexi bacterium]|nr:4Fe-4S dicluster domain-containing protein [Chloroflexota bacterium]